MKKARLITVFLLAGLSLLVNAQDKKNAVKLNLISPFIKTINLAYERVLNENSGLVVHAYYTGYQNKSNDPTTKTEGFGIIPEYRLYVSDKKNAPAGFFVAPFLRYDSFKVTDTYDDGTKNTGSYSDFGAGLVIGIQSVFSNIVTLEAYIGPQYIFGNEKNDSDGEIETPQLKGVMPRGGVTIGILF